MSCGQFLCNYHYSFIHIFRSISQCFGMHSHSLLDIFISKIYSSYIMWLLIKQRFSSLRHGWPLPILAILFRYIGFIVPRNFKLFGFSNLSILSVPDEGYSRNASWALNLISTFLFKKCSWFVSLIINDDSVTALINLTYRVI